MLAAFGEFGECAAAIERDPAPGQAFARNVRRLAADERRRHLAAAILPISSSARQLSCSFS